MATPNYKLTYFNGRGRAENVRLLFEVAGVKYEDVRIEHANWPAIKPKTLFGQLPTFEVDGKEVGQSKAISRYVAQKHGLNGSNAWEALEIDIICEHCDDVATPFTDIVFGGHGDEKKKELSKKYYDETAPKIFGFLEKLLCQNKEGSGFFVGNKISMADIVFLSTSDWVITPEHPDVLDAFPKLKALLVRIKAHDKVAAWIKKRPVTAW